MQNQGKFEVGDLVIDVGGGFFGIVESCNDNEVVYHSINNSFVCCHATATDAIRRCTVYEAMILVGKVAVAEFVEHCNPMTPAIDILNDELRDIENDNGEKKPYWCYNWLFTLLDKYNIRKFSEVDKLRTIGGGEVNDNV